MITYLLIAAVVGIVGFGAALTARSKKDFADANEVVPGVKSAAPASWAGAHSREAKLHRRLRESVLAARANPRFAELGLAARTKQIETEALAIDERLIAAAGLPTTKRAAAVAEFEVPVAALEDAVEALVLSTTVGESKELLEQNVSAADIKLQALADARAEVELIDRRIAEPGISEPGAAQTDPGTATS